MPANKKIHNQFYLGGCDTDSNTEFVDTEKNVIDRKNMRISSVSGQKKVSHKINGEVVEYDLFVYPDSSTRYLRGQNPDMSYTYYVCLASCEVRGYLVCFWASNWAYGTADPIITIDDKIVAESDGLPFVYNQYLQHDTSDRCVNGEVFIANEYIEPMIFDIGDLLDNYDSDTEKYFDDFDLSLYTVSLNRQLDVPVFVELESVGSLDGLAGGMYAYAIRYVDSDGNRTGWSPSTPLIPVVANDSSLSTQYPGSKTYGTEETYNSIYGIKIKFRITNKQNYSFVELKRVSWNSDSGVGFVPAAEYVEYPYSLSPGEITTVTFTDSIATTWLPLSEEEETQTLSAINGAKAIRYYENRLFLGNISFASKDLSGTSVSFLDSGGNKMYPFIHDMGREGHSDVYNATYYRNYIGGERYGYALLCRDENGDKSFALPVPGYENYAYSNRRVQLSSESSAISHGNWKGVSRCSDINNNAPVNTHEVFGFSEDDGTQEYSSGWSGVKKTDDSDVVTISEFGGIDYNPLTPKRFTDTFGHHDYKVNEYVSTVFIGGETAGRESYDPEHFAPRYYSSGMALHGVDGLPSWVKSMSIVRTKPAGRVIASGLAVYTTTKSDNTILFYSDDLENNAITRSLFENNSTNYKIEVVSPLGYFSEMYAGEHPTTGADRGIDMMTYARMIYNSNLHTTSPAMINRDGSNTFYTTFGAWRNAASDRFTGNSQWSISGATRRVYSTTGRNNYYEIVLSSQIYANRTVVSLGAFDSNNNMEWQEPWYIVNIIDTDASVSDNNVNEYLETGSHIKIESIVGKISENELSFNLVDERWEDCIPSEYTNGVVSPDAATNVFVWIDDTDQNTNRRWINVGNKSSGDIVTILTDLTNNGFYNASVGGGGTVPVYGVYWHDWNSDISHTIKFEQPAAYASYDKGFFIPSMNSEVVVKYDNRFPVKFFGGDGWIGESVFSPIDGTSLNNGNVDKQSLSAVGFPYCRYHFNDNYKVVKSSTNVLQRFQVRNYIDQEWIRQLSVMFTGVNRVCVPLTYNIASTGTSCDSGQSSTQSFPMIHYVQRPQDWNSTCENNFDGGNEIDPQYKADFPGEFSYWEYGGFKTIPLFNPDYEQWNSYEIVNDRPDVGFVEQTDFCSLVIWSNEREINVQNDPGLKSFPSTNQYALSDAQGAIKYLWDSDSDRGGNNIYAFTDRGVCLLLTGKNQLSDVGGNTLGYVSPAEGVIQQEMWLQKDIGMNDEMWRSAGEFGKLICWANKKSVYLLFNNDVKDIGKIGYYNTVYNDGLKYIEDGYVTRVSSIVDRKHEEYYLNLYESGVVSKNFVFDISNMVWTGQYDYNFEQYISKQYGTGGGDVSQTYGVKDGSIYLLDSGFQINGSDIRASVKQVCNAEQPYDKEYISIGIASNNKPTRVDFAESISALPECSLYEGMSAPVNVYYLKDYGKWTNKVPRRIAGDRNRLQGRIMVFEVIHDDAEDFYLIDSIVNYKSLMLQI